MIPCKRKRSRRSRRTITPRDWASLDKDLVQLIGWRVLAGDVRDYVRFRAVCSHWHASAVGPRGRGVRDARFHPRRWMMLPEGHGLYPGHPHLTTGFVNLSTGAVVRAHLNELLDDHAILDSVDGLLLLHRDHDTAVRLVHPFTGDIAELPPLDSLLPQMDGDTSKLRRVRAAVAVDGATGAITVTLALGLLHRVAHATAGAQRWTLSTWTLLPLMNAVSFQGKLYAMHPVYQGTRKAVHIYRIDPSTQTTSPEKIAECPRDKIPYPLSLVECSSELLLVGCSDIYSRTHLAVYRLAELITGKIAPITSIGDDQALFIDERALCVSPTTMGGLSSIRPNSIICIRSLRNQERLDQYRLDTGVWTPACDVRTTKSLPPNPSTLFHHIFACCRPEYWNKGLLFCRETEPQWPVKQNLRIGA